MRDIQLYEQLLGLEAPWKVESVTLKVAEQQIEVRVSCRETLWGRPECSQRMHAHDWEERRWRHLDSCQFKTIIVARVPRVGCLEHGTQSVAVPWAEKFGRFSRLFERLAIDLMRECSVTAACQILRISWEEADGIKQRAVARGLRRKRAQPVKRLGVDEKCAGRGHDYVTVVAQLQAGGSATVEYVGSGSGAQERAPFPDSERGQQAGGYQAPLALRLGESAGHPSATVRSIARSTAPDQPGLGDRGNVPRLLGQ